VPVNFRSKLIEYTELASWREGLARLGGKLVVTNGCFDLLHLGHATYLEAARQQGTTLLVGVNSDSAVRALKGEGRPLNSEMDRALVVAALESVSYVTIFPDVRATEFLARAKPNVYVKGGDYTLDTLDQNERRVVESSGGQIILLPVVSGKSTTSLLERAKK